MRLKPNRPDELRARGRVLYEARQELIALAVSEDRIIGKRDCFWLRGQYGAVTLLGRFKDGAMRWEKGSLESLRA